MSMLKYGKPLLQQLPLIDSSDQSHSNNHIEQKPDIKGEPPDVKSAFSMTGIISPDGCIVRLYNSPCLPLC